MMTGADVVLFDVFEKREGHTRPSLVYCGDDEDAKATAAHLIHDVGFDPVGAGPLEVGRYIEPFSLLIARLADEGDGAPAPAYRVEHSRSAPDVSPTRRRSSRSPRSGAREREVHGPNDEPIA